MSFVEVKGFINSTVGTDEFKPLDQMIIGSKGLKASENFYARVLSNAKTIYFGETYNLKMKMEWGGTFFFRYNHRTANTGTGSAMFSVFVNDSQVFSHSSDPTGTTGGAEYVSDVISFSKGDTIEVVYSLDSDRETSLGVLNYLDIYADVTDLSAFTILEK